MPEQQVAAGASGNLGAFMINAYAIFHKEVLCTIPMFLLFILVPRGRHVLPVGGRCPRAAQNLYMRLETQNLNKLQQSKGLRGIHSVGSCSPYYVYTGP